MNELLRSSAWFQVDGEDEMIVLAEPVLTFLDSHGLSSYEGPRRGRHMPDGSFEIELTFCTEEDAEAARCVWRAYRCMRA